MKFTTTSLTAAFALTFITPVVFADATISGNGSCQVQYLQPNGVDMQYICGGGTIIKIQNGSCTTTENSQLIQCGLINNAWVPYICNGNPMKWERLSNDRFTGPGEEWLCPPPFKLGGPGFVL